MHLRPLLLTPGDTMALAWGEPSLLPDAHPGRKGAGQVVGVVLSLTSSTITLLLLLFL